MVMRFRSEGVFRCSWPVPGVMRYLEVVRWPLLSATVVQKHRYLSECETRGGSGLESGDVTEGESSGMRVIAS